MKWPLIILALLIGLTAAGYSAKKRPRNTNVFLIQTAYSFIYKRPKMKSKIIDVVEEGEKVLVLSRLSQKKKWLKVKIRNKVGYILTTSVTKKLQPVNENIYNIVTKKNKNKTLSSSKRGFSEEEEISAASKGFSEEEEISAATKGFSEEEELSAASKGFSEEEEISAAAKGFDKKGKRKKSSRKRKGFTKKDRRYRNKVQEKNNNKVDTIPIIFAKYYVFNKKAYYAQQKKILRQIKKRKAKTKKRKKSKR